MKNQPKFNIQLQFSLILSMVCLILIFSSCEEYDPGNDPPEVPLKIDSFIIGPKAANLHALNGNVKISIPESALKEQATLEIREGPTDYEDDFVIKSIEIKPENIFFKIPVELILKYDGQLSCGKDPCNAEKLVIYHFNSEKAFDKRLLSDMTWINGCYLDRKDCCIETEIQSGGIFVIGEASLGQPADYPD